MNTTPIPAAVSLCLAAVMTLALMGGVNELAQPAGASAQPAQWALASVAQA